MIATIRRVVGRWGRGFQLLRRRSRGEIDHAVVLSGVREEAALSPRFMLMVVLAVGVAILGLLQNSVAVIIGAMLLSPLMGPIVALGFALNGGDYRQVRTSVGTLMVGVALALLVAMLVVAISPLIEPTPEILARTRPNLFDLLVATFSGVAGGYAAIKRRGEAIVGVAIATALMPPLAVVGYGLARGDLDIMFGAALLFVTNLVAIAYCVALVARWYSFTGWRRENRRRLEDWIAAALLIALAVPLAVSLADIRRDTLIARAARAEVRAAFPDPRTRFEGLTASFADTGALLVDAIVYTSEFREDAPQLVESRLERRFDVPMQVSLRQVVLAEHDLYEQFSRAQARTALLQTDLRPWVTKLATERALAADIRKQATVPIQAVQVEAEERTATILAGYTSRGSLDQLWRFEKELRAAHPAWTIRVVPLSFELPDLQFAPGQTEITADQLRVLDYIGWAASRWGASRVQVVGYASSEGSSARNARIAATRAEAVARVLQAAGISTNVTTEFPAIGQPQLERQRGRDYLRRVAVRLD